MTWVLRDQISGRVFAGWTFGLAGPFFGDDHEAVRFETLEDARGSRPAAFSFALFEPEEWPDDRGPLGYICAHCRRWLPNLRVTARDCEHPTVRLIEHCSIDEVSEGLRLARDPGRSTPGRPRRDPAGPRVVPS